jgi:dipeptidyl aminopeptidase/acylaminoacyl peptidase
MSTQTIAPYGEWQSPITATMLTEAGRPLSFASIVGEEIWWSEMQLDKGGRTAVMVRRADGEIAELLPEPWNARSRVHEYGGVSWIAVPAPASGGSYALVFANFADQRLYRLDPGSEKPVSLTPEPESPGALRYADLRLGPDGTEVLAVRERHQGKEISRHIVAVALDGSGVREIVGGSDFLAHPRVSPDGTRLAWLAWDHPNMPWDGTELRVGSIGADGRVTGFSTVLGGPTEAVFQPEWASNDSLYAVSDRSGWWNLYEKRVSRAGEEPVSPGEEPVSRAEEPVSAGEPRPLHPAAEEFGTPLWLLGFTSYGILGDGRLLVIHGHGGLGVLDPTTGELTDFDLPYQSYSPMLSISGDIALLGAGGPMTPPALIRLDTTTGATEVVRQSIDAAKLPDEAYLPIPESTTLYAPDGRDIHAHVYPPRNPDFAAPEGEKPPYVVFVHGGPTANSPAVLSLEHAYFTSRGIGVLDVNYGGSTGYGRAYRERLRRQWGVVDVEDCVAAAQALVDRGDADPARLAIRGGSAGGWTTLCAVTRSKVFAAGTSLFGVTDIRRFKEITHDFESRYLDGLIGPFPEADAVAEERSPLTHVASTACPVLLLQGADDPVVPLSQAEIFRDALVKKGIPHALLVFEGEQHGFRKAESIIAATEAELSFYGQVLGFTPVDVARVELTG